MRALLSVLLVLAFAPGAAAHVVAAGPLYADHHDNSAWCESNGHPGLQKSDFLDGNGVLWPADTRVAPSPGDVAACT